MPKRKRIILGTLEHDDIISINGEVIPPQKKKKHPFKVI